MKKIICVGSATRDIFLGVTVNDKQPKKICFQAGEKIYTNSYRETVGGGAINVGFGLKKLGFRSFIFARTDKSFTGKWIQKQIGKLRLKKNYMQQSGKISSETSVIVGDAIEQDRVILRSGDSVEKFDVLRACKKFRERVDWIYISSQKKNHLKNMDILINFAEEKKAKIAFNPSNYQIENDREKILERLASVSILFVNKEEAKTLLHKNLMVEMGVNDLRSDNERELNLLAEKLIEHRPQIVVITDGNNGMLVAAIVSQKYFSYYLPAINIEKVADTTGAGDATVSGFLATFINDENELEMKFKEKLKRALAGGLANATAVIQEEGAVNGLLKPSALKRGIKKMLNKN